MMDINIVNSIPENKKIKIWINWLGGDLMKKIISQKSREVLNWKTNYISNMEKQIISRKANCT